MHPEQVRISATYFLQLDLHSVDLKQRIPKIPNTHKNVNFIIIQHGRDVLVNALVSTTIRNNCDGAQQ